MKEGKVNAEKVAQKAGVSKWTVIRAFKDDANIAPATRDKVLKVASEMNYVPNLLARSLATNRTEQVAILVDDYTNPFMLGALGYLTARLQLENIQSVLMNINSDFSHRKGIISAQQRRFDAIVSFGVSFDPHSIAEEFNTHKDLPVFVLAREEKIAKLPSLYTDATLAIQKICETAFLSGKRKPYYFGKPKNLSTVLGRRAIYQNFWKEHGVATIPEISVGAYDITQAREVIFDFATNFYKANDCDMIICENDLLAIAAIDVFRHGLGLDVPSQISIIGFDDIALAQTSAYNLTTIRQPVEEMIDFMVDMITAKEPFATHSFLGQPIFRSSL